MRATVQRVWDTLCAGRAPRDVAMRLAAAFGIATALYLGACIFMLLEPIA